ncbi:DUF2530 domain-containing protein [Corynebacterium sp. 335C]
MDPREQMQDAPGDPGSPPVNAPRARDAAQPAEPASAEPAEAPELPRWAEDPRPALAAGIAAFALGAPAAFAAAGPQAGWTCVTGAVVGTAGWGVYAWQRAAVRRGSRTAQVGIRADG